MISGRLSAVDLSRPIQAVIPGVQGRLLEALASAGQTLTSGQAARTADCSENQASKILRELAQLGLVTRTDAGRVAQYQLSVDNYATRKLLEICDFRGFIFREMTRLSDPLIRYSPGVWIAVFGSTARSGSNRSSDIDLAIVRPDLTIPEDPQYWDQLVFDFTGAIEKQCGNEVNLVHAWRSEVTTRANFWAEVLRDGITVAGAAPVQDFCGEGLPPSEWVWNLYWPESSILQATNAK
jgi:predicted nucleotidyltransferase